MKNRILNISVLLLLLSLVASCGKSPEDEDKSENKVQRLETGSSFLNAPRMWIEFGSVSKGKKYTRTLSYTAEYTGELVLSKTSYGLGRGCVDSNGEKDYTLEFSYKLRKSGEKSYKKVEARNGSFTTIHDYIKLEDGDTLNVDIVLSSLVSCSFIEITLLATF